MRFNTESFVNNLRMMSVMLLVIGGILGGAMGFVAGLFWVHDAYGFWGTMLAWLGALFVTTVAISFERD